MTYEERVETAVEKIALEFGATTADGQTADTKTLAEERLLRAEELSSWAYEIDRYREALRVIQCGSKGCTNPGDGHCQGAHRAWGIAEKALKEQENPALQTNQELK